MLDVPAAAAVFTVAMGVIYAPSQQQPAFPEDEAADANVNDAVSLVVYFEAPFRISRIVFRWLRSWPASISVTRATVSFPRSECIP